LNQNWAKEELLRFGRFFCEVRSGYWLTDWAYCEKITVGFMHSLTVVTTTIWFRFGFNSTAIRLLNITRSQWGNTSVTADPL